MKIKKRLILISSILGIGSIFFPFVFHVSPNAIYQFWAWGTTISFGLTSSEINISYNSELAFLIPALVAVSLLIFGSLLNLNGLRKGRSKYIITGSIILIATPLVLSLLWQLIHILILDYPTFWGSAEGYNYFLPSFSLYFQLISGIIALICLKFKK